MDRTELIKRLSAAGHNSGHVETDILSYMTDGPDLLLEESDFKWAAEQLGVPVPYIRALYEVESSGNSFIDGRPTILFEPHIFSKLTGHVYDNSHPKISSRTWNRALYPKLQSDRYNQLIDAILLDPLAGFASASYGGFQILGMNYARCNAYDAMAFAWQEAQSEADQLSHFVEFIKSDAILWNALRKGDWVHVAKRYNGTAYYKNRYDVRLAQAVRKWS